VSQFAEDPGVSSIPQRLVANSRFHGPRNSAFITINLSFRILLSNMFFFFFFLRNNLLHPGRKDITPISTNMIKHLHFQKCLLMRPHPALPLSISHTPSHFVSLEMQSSPDVVKCSRFFSDHLVSTVVILHSELFGTRDRRSNRDRAALITNRTPKGRGDVDTG